MRQSERMRLRKAYLEHPLRVSYEGERRVLLTSSPILRFYYCVLAVQFILLFVYGNLLFRKNSILEAETLVVILVFSIVNLLLMCAIVPALITDRKEKMQNCSLLKEKYKKLGLIEVADPCREACGEWDNDREEWICSATGEQLNYREFRWCQVKGNCKHCSKFVTAYLGEDALEYWNYEIQK